MDFLLAVLREMLLGYKYFLEIHRISKKDWQLSPQFSEKDCQLSPQFSEKDWQLSSQISEQDWQLSQQFSEKDWHLSPWFSENVLKETVLRDLSGIKSAINQ